MPETSEHNPPTTVELDFVKGHIAATMTLIHGLIDQGAVNRDALDNFFAGFMCQVPHTRDTLPLRLVIDQWRKGLREGEPENELRHKLFGVIEGGR